ncbi:MAG: siderophore ABC transporter substrate-binding protein [Paracoccaceae bacterium]
MILLVSYWLDPPDTTDYETKSTASTNVQATPITFRMNMMRAVSKIISRSLLALTLAAIAPPLSAEPLEITTAQGKITLPYQAKTIVALDGAAIDTLAALGAIPQAVVAPLYVEALSAQVKEARVVGTLFEPDFEKIAALQPDLIVVGGRSVAQAAPLGRIGQVIDMSIGQDALNDGLARLATFGEITGRREKAQELAQALEAKIAKARGLIEGQGNALIVMANGPKLSVFGPQSRFGWLHSALNWAPAVADILEAPHGEAVSFEYIAKANPDTLLVIDRGRAVAQGTGNAQATLDTPLIAGTTAAKNGRILYLSPAEIYVTGGGIQALNVTLDEIIAALSQS